MESYSAWCDVKVRLHSAAMHGNTSSVLEIISSIPDCGVDWIEDTAETAAIFGHREIVDQMISKGAKNWNAIMTGAVCSNSKDLVDEMLRKGANDYNRGLINAIDCNNKFMVLLMVKLGATNKIDAVERANLRGYHDIVNLI
jgi:hypothetical protein